MSEDLDNSFACRQFDWKMEFWTIFSEIENKVGRKPCFHVKIQHLNSGYWIHAKVRCKQMADEVFEKSSRSLLVPIFRQVDEATESHRDRVDNPGDLIRIEFG
ncbi:MAG: hypothetical protein DMF03_13485 [Verrucomicrobia bacterium]|nr:MAG: hypothetical protein DMF03_13485 [Verrucomicrobiota bacterium]